MFHFCNAIVPVDPQGCLEIHSSDLPAQFELVETSC